MFKVETESSETRAAMQRRVVEDRLDWLENQNRSASECRRTDQKFIAGWAALTAVLAMVASVVANWVSANPVGFKKLNLHTVSQLIVGG